jgi:hypothetical protein
MKIDLKNKKLYIKAGLYYEYSGLLKISIKVYLIFIKTYFFNSILGIRFLCCCHWLNLFKKRILLFFKNNKLVNQEDFESLLFKQKYHQYLGDFQNALELQRKLNTINPFQLVDRGNLFYKNNYKNFIFNNFLRLLLLEKNRTLKGFNLQKFFKKMKGNNSKKEFWVTNRVLIHFKNKYDVNVPSKNIFWDLKGFEKKFDTPILSEIITYFNSEPKPKENNIKLFTSLNSLDLKLYLITIKKKFFLENNVNLIFRNSKNNFASHLRFNDSYSCLNRNFNSKLYQILKSERDAYHSIDQILILKTIYQYSFIDKKNPKPYHYFTKIQGRLGLGKNTFKFRLFFPSVKIENKGVNFDEKYNIKLNLATEKFYEKKKISALFRLCLFNILINFRLSLIFKDGENYKKINFNGDINQKVYFEEEIKKKKDFIKILKKNQILLLFCKILNYKIAKKKNLQKKLLIDKILEIFVSRYIFKKLNLFQLKAALIVIILRKKKYTKAYNLLRQQCFDEPYSIQFWQLLSIVEKKIGLVVSKTLRFTLRIIKKFPDSIPGITFAGNLCSVFGSGGYALAEFFQAYRWKNNSPFLNLSISIQYLNGSVNRRTKLKGLSLLLCFSFYFRYKILRFFIIKVILQENYLSSYLNLETLYNSGRILLFLGIHNKAKVNFKSIFELKKTVSTVKKFKRNRENFMKFAIKKEAHFNSLLLDECGGMNSNLINSRMI